MLTSDPVVRMYRGQRYEHAETVPHTRRDGTETQLHRWRSHCADCGSEFVTSTPAMGSVFSPGRRCKDCKRPGSRVGTVQS